MVPRLNEYGEELDEDNEDDGMWYARKEEMFRRAECPETV